MSGLIVGLVLRTPILDKFNTNAKFIAVIYADHAWEDGTHAYPAVETVASISGLDTRTVQRYLRTLEDIGMLIPDGKGPKGTNRYKFPLQEQDGAFRLGLKAKGGDTVTPQSNEKTADSGDSLTGCHPDGGDTDSGDTDSGDTGVTQLNNPSVNNNVVIVINDADIFAAYEREIGILTPMIRDAISTWLDADKVPREWLVDVMRIAVTANKRSWSYCEGILRNWIAHGRGAPKPVASNTGNRQEPRTKKPSRSPESSLDALAIIRKVAQDAKKHH